VYVRMWFRYVVIWARPLKPKPSGQSGAGQTHNPALSTQPVVFDTVGGSILPCPSRPFLLSTTIYPYAGPPAFLPPYARLLCVPLESSMCWSFPILCLVYLLPTDKDKGSRRKRGALRSTLCDAVLGFRGNPLFPRGLRAKDRRVGHGSPGYPTPLLPFLKCRVISNAERFRLCCMLRTRIPRQCLRRNAAVVVYTRQGQTTHTHIHTEYPYLS